MDNITPSGPQPAPSTDPTPFEPSHASDVDDGAAPDGVDSSSAVANVTVTLVKNVEQQVDDFVRARPLASMAIALTAGIGLAFLTVSLIQSQPRLPYGLPS